ncbi:MAG: DNA topoisomerase I [Candidatus Vogelbacteria bacterium RIFOXYD1_FULL_44_32]|uniref:DNA topoisomerase 1 n=1 Tax=Candidatus Vogelbacteria bacterium RIFOXYD1_FULL_44_32 TaxID=1802438 RepID=A0A1G2QDM8_9BACT|nr:MAG: DNA topoisomerase I [Candidatus Vogelbacteria bacterium RIFOXYD1_FULL_44_32]
MKLLIVESPAKAKTISKYLDGAYTVRASVGHIRDLPKSNKNAIDIEGGFIPRYEISKDKYKVVADLKSLAKKAEEVVLATDPDREGEAIAWHIKEALGLKKPKRIVFHEITPEAVQEAIKHPRQIDDDLRQAQEARRVLDRLFGYDLSGLIWTKLRYGLSAGRVQSPALRILVEREKEIEAFIPEQFWVITAEMKTASGTSIPFTCSLEPKTEAEANTITKKAKQEAWKIKDISETEAKRNPRAPFTTSTLQQTASSRLGYSPSVTMRLAQKLYEKGFITYMRTDSTNLSQQAQAEIKSIVSREFGAEHFSANIYSKKSKNAQEAHEAIRPTHVTTKSAGFSDQEKRLYKLIWERTVASQMAPANILRTKVTAVCADKSVPDFLANGSQVLYSGWLLADPRARGEDVDLPKLKANEKLELISINSEGKTTLPPPRYSEAGLVKELEKRGIGRPSTYAPTIKTIIDRGYVEKEARSLKPTDIGVLVSDFITEHFADYVSDTFTAEMEDELDEIASGKRSYTKTMQDFYGPFTKAIKSKKNIEKISNLGEAPQDIKCPLCDKPMIIKLGKGGKFYSCNNFPACNGARTMEGKVQAGPKDTGRICPKCGKANLVEREGRFGKFISCSSYPKCKHIEQDPNAEKPGDTGVGCPLCKKGTMVEKRGRFGLFYGCSNYPDCKHIVKSKPTGAICGYARETGPCPHLMMAGTKTIPERCSDKTCPNHNLQKLDKNDN